MEAYDLCIAIRKRILTNAAEVLSYGSWSDEFCASHIREIPGKLIECDGFFRVDPNDLTEDQMIDLGFGKWSEENPIRLIPLWLFPFLVDEFEAGCIDGSGISKLRREEMDNDHRFGCIAYGVNPKK